MKTASRSLILLAAALALPAATAQASRYVVGTVWSQHLNPASTDDDMLLPNAQVSLLQNGTNAFAPVLTGPNGYYSFTHVPAGSYQLLVSADGHVTQTQDLTVTDATTTIAYVRLPRIEDPDCAKLGSDPSYLSVKDFGAKGDGKTDDYDALNKAAAFLTQPRADQATRRLTLVFPPGTYRLNRYSKWLPDPVKPSTGTWINPATGLPQTADGIVFSGENGGGYGFRVLGCHAKISVKADFHQACRAPMASKPGRCYPDAYQLNALVFRHAHDFSVSGLDVAGNVEQMTRDTATVEGNGSGIRTGVCRDYTLEKLYVHDFSTDGLELGVPKPEKVYDANGNPVLVKNANGVLVQQLLFHADQNATVRDVKSARNARGALSLIEIAGGTFTRLQLINSGRTGGYAGHAPRHGVDIEPDVDADPTQYGYADMKTANHTFENVVFAGNLGSQFTTAKPQTIQNVTIRKSFLAAAADSSPYAVILAADNGVLEDSIVNTGAGYIAPTWQNRPGASTTIARNVIYTRGQAFLSLDSTPVLIDSNKIVGAQTAYRSYMPYLRNPALTFKNNTLYYPAAFLRGDLTTAYQVAGLLQGVQLSAGNRFSTPVSGSGKFLSISYNASPVAQDLYKGGIKPTLGAPFADPYSQP